MHERHVIDRLAGQGIDTVVSLPCDKTKDLCFLFPKRLRTVVLTREEDGIGISAGLALAGGRPALHMQSSGLGNSLNAVMSLTVTFDLPLPILASWRGVYHESIPAQVPFNRALPGVLDALDIPYTIIRDETEAGLIDAVIENAYGEMRPHVALIVPSFWEGPGDVCTPAESPLPPRSRKSLLEYHRTIREPGMTRFAAIRVIADLLEGELVVANIGVPSKELYAARDRPENFYMLGSYTQATPIGLGLALQSGRDVVVLDGDGSLLGSAVLPVVAAEAPANLTVVCLDNGAFGSTGNQPTSAYGQVDMELLAIAAGIRNTAKAHTPEEIREAWEARGRGPAFIHIVLKPGNAPVPNVPYTPEEIRNRFMGSLQRV
ncbi:sulfopyruvate decarboxylase subunit beta [Methanoculleus sp. FWC-SCC1]|uniref:sulfopyruvate decarboxylase n=1 Tax=Methanoculleus frigidifontis TaxID=2584085 RepID=A0ABT8MA45_9EURY|nr:sulfopyruvate decarboxylase subunit beta [Methanoculleus sp. FWC-SCC1]MDN7024779.1 sulfopyruvate decarboxylase subunit beta [Methanoculleus sp. FWC-SCC1]